MDRAIRNYFGKMKLVFAQKRRCFSGNKDPFPEIEVGKTWCEMRLEAVSSEATQPQIGSPGNIAFDS